MNNKLVSLLICVAVGIILVGSVLAPIIKDVSDSSEVAYVNGGVAFEKAEGASVSLSYDGSAYSINGTPATTEYPFSILSDQLVIELTDIAPLAGADTLPLVSEVSSWTATVDPDAKSIAVSYVKGGETVTFTKTYEFCYYHANSGDYVSSAYIAPSFFLNTIDDLVGFGVPYPNYVSMIYMGEVYTKGVLTDYELEYDLESIPGIAEVSHITAAPTYNDPVLGNDEATFAVWIAPASIEGVTDLGNSTTPLYAVIPLMVIVALMAMVARVALNRN